MGDVGYEVRSFDCRGDAERRSPGFVLQLPYEVCLVRRGCFRFRDRRGRVLVDATTALMGGPDEVDYEVEHPLPGGDQDTFLRLDAATVAAVAGGEVDLPALTPVSPAAELAHRRLLVAHARRPGTHLEEELALDLTASLLAAAQPLRVRAGWSVAHRRAQRLVDDARTVLVGDPDRSLVELAAAVGCSPHHLSRLFRREAGVGVAAYRLALRVQDALDGLADGAPSLAELAAACGFADHAHLTRTLVDRFGIPPSALRTEWALGRWLDAEPDRPNSRTRHVPPSEGSRLQVLGNPDPRSPATAAVAASRTGPGACDGRCDGRPVADGGTGEA